MGLGGGFKHLVFYPDPWGFMIEFDLRIFFKGLAKIHHRKDQIFYLSVDGLKPDPERPVGTEGKSLWISIYPTEIPHVHQVETVDGGTMRKLRS